MDTGAQRAGRFYTGRERRALLRHEPGLTLAHEKGSSRARRLALAAAPD